MINRKKLYSLIRSYIGTLKASQLEGINAILDKWEVEKFTDLRHLAYMLATAWHETAKTMQAIEEYGKGKKHSYGKPDPVTGHAYYGRGLVQLTWASNYKKMGKILGIPLYENPSMALDLDIAVEIMFEGMLTRKSFKGDFTGKSLEDYFNDKKDDPINARRVVNGTDRAELIAEYHKKILLALKTASMDEPVVVPAPTKPADGEYFGAPWMGIDLDLLGRTETDPELNARYVPEWKKVGLPGYKTLVGIKHAWCSIRMTKVLRQVGVNVKGLTAGARSFSTWGKKSPFWFGAALDIVHKSGGRHVCFFLYWIDEKKKIAATLDGNRGNKFCVARTDLSGKGDTLKAGPRYPKDVADGQIVSMSEVLKAYPIFKVGSVGSGTR